MYLYYYIYKYDIFYSMHFFWDVSLGDVNRSMPWYYETIPGTRELHSVHSKDTGNIFSIETRKYACFCEFYINTNGLGFDHCMNDAYVKQWKYVPLNPKGLHLISTWQEMHTHEVVVSLDHDQVSYLVKQGT